MKKIFFFSFETFKDNFTLSESLLPHGSTAERQEVSQTEILLNRDVGLGGGMYVSIRLPQLWGIISKWQASL